MSRGSVAFLETLPSCESKCDFLERRRRVDQLPRRVPACGGSHQMPVPGSAFPALPAPPAAVLGRASRSRRWARSRRLLGGPNPG